MFNFQKEVVINSADQYAIVSAPTAGKPSAAGTKFPKKLRVHGGGDYFGNYIVDKKAYKTAPIPGTNFSLTITPQAADFNKYVQILIELGLDSDYRGDYGSALWYFRKPIVVDVMLQDTQDKCAEVIYKAIKAAIPVEYKFVDVKLNDAGSADTVTVSGADSYQKVLKVVLSEFYCEDRCAGNGSEEIRTITEMDNSALVTAAPGGWFKYTANNVEFGTYDYIIHNLRLPTYENFRFTSPAAVEMPMKGREYHQFSFAYCVPRQGLGGLSAVGQTIHSTTLHTFYVEDSLAEDFKDKLEEIGVTIEDIDRTGNDHVTVLPDAFASSQDLANAAAIAVNADAIETNAEAIEANSEADEALKGRVAAVEAKNTQQDTTIAGKADASALAAKADAANVYTKSEVYQKSETYSKTEADEKFEPKA